MHFVMQMQIESVAAGREGCQQAAFLSFSSLALGLGLRQPSIKSTHKQLFKVEPTF
jgi:hypothetical protein